jgi:bifunctional enzyme CysN/CysC
VDDGKSTLIGRLLYETNSIYEDQLVSLQKASAQREGLLDLSLVTDGLRAEREQAITIDVAYRYFCTPRRKFIIADAPGHQQYTRNMVTAASNSDLAVLLVDARKGVLEQTRIHTYIAWLLGIRRFVIAVNKMDLVNFDFDVFSSIQNSFARCCSFLGEKDQYYVPLSALEGDNVIRSSPRMPWYEGLSLLDLLETLPLAADRNSKDLRFPVQGVIRPNQNYRGYSGQIASGMVRPGQQVIALPSLQVTRINSVELYGEKLQEAVSPTSVTLLLEDHLDLGRGDMLADPERKPATTKCFSANVVWMSHRTLRVNAPYLLKHTTQTVCASITRVYHKIDTSTFESTAVGTLGLNDVGAIQVETHKPIFCDTYESNRATGSFIIIDPLDNDTVGAGMITEVRSSERINEQELFSAFQNETKRQHRGLAVWLTGLSGAGKTTICEAVYTDLLSRGFRVEMLDGDVLRKHLNSDLGFTKTDRDENIRRIGFVAQLLVRNGVIVLVAAISPYRATRDEVRHTIGSFLEVYVNAPLRVCEERDQKGLYRRARAGAIRGFTGIDDPYEPPAAPDVQCDTNVETVKTSAEKVLKAVLDFYRAQGRSHET